LLRKGASDVPRWPPVHFLNFPVFDDDRIWGPRP